MIRTLVLDLDGPLLDGIQRHYFCYSNILKAHGFEPVPVQIYWEKKRNRVNRREMLALSNAAEIYDDFLVEWIAAIEERACLALDKLQGRVIQILEEWKRAGIRLLLATMRNNPANLHWQLGELGIAPLLDHIIVVGSIKAGANKSSEVEPFLAGENPEQIVWIGDTEVDVRAARNLNVRVCAVTCGLRTEEYLKSLSPDMLETDLAAFAKNKLNELC